MYIGNSELSFHFHLFFSSEFRSPGGANFIQIPTQLNSALPKSSKLVDMDLSDKVQIGLSAAAVFVGMQIVQNGKSAAKSFSAYQHIVNGTQKLVQCKEIITSEAGRAINPEQRKVFVDNFLQ